MKVTKWLGAVFIGATLLVAGCSNETPKVGVVDYERIQKESKFGSDLIKKATDQQKILQEEAKNMDAELKKMDPAKAQQEFMAKQQEFQKRAQDLDKQIATEFITEVQKASSVVAQEKKLGIVLTKERVVVGSVDITDDVIGKLGGKVEPKPAEGEKPAEGAKAEEKKEAPKQ